MSFCRVIASSAWSNPPAYVWWRVMATTKFSRIYNFFTERRSGPRWIIVFGRGMGNSHTSLKLFFLTSWHASCRMSNSYVQEKAALNVNPITTSWLVHQLSNCHDWCKFSQLAVCGGRSLSEKIKHDKLSFPDNNFLSQQMPLSYGVMEGYPLPQISAAVVWGPYLVCSSIDINVHRSRKLYCMPTYQQTWHCVSLLAQE